MRETDKQDAGTTPEHALALAFSPSLDQLLPQAIEFNYDQIKHELAEWTARYAGLHVTEDGIRGAKSDRARLNKARTALENARKEVKRRCMAPYDAFEAKVKELVALIDEPMREIDGQLDRYEQERIARKRAQIAKAWDAVVGDLAGVLDLQDVFDERWLNASTTMTEIGANVNATLSKVRGDLEAIGSACDGDAERTQAARARFLSTGRDLAGVLRWMENEKRTRAALAAREEIRKRDDAARAAQRPHETASSEGQGKEFPSSPAPQEEPATAEQEPASPNDPVLTFRLEFTGRRSALIAMRGFMAANGITYTKL